MSDEPRTPGAGTLDTSDSSTRASNQERFLAEIELCNNVTKAAKAVPMHRDTHYDWMADPEYVKRFRSAQEAYRDLVRETVQNVALFGTPQEVYYQGKFLGMRHERSERMLEMEAKAHCPEYRDKQEISGPGGAPIAIQVLTGVPQPESE